VRNDKARVALVAGANRGLGFETARQLLVKGLGVVLAGRDAAGLERARRSLPEQSQPRAITVQMDVTSLESIAAAQRAVTKEVGSVEVLINNAAVLLAENERSGRRSTFGRRFLSASFMRHRPRTPPCCVQRPWTVHVFPSR